jgi:hypothetical protein
MQKVFANLGLAFGFFSGFPPTRARSLLLFLMFQPTSNGPAMGMSLLLYEQGSPGVYSTPHYVLATRSIYKKYTMY